VFQLDPNAKSLKWSEGFSLSILSLRGTSRSGLVLAGWTLLASRSGGLCCCCRYSVDRDSRASSTLRSARCIRTETKLASDRTRHQRNAGRITAVLPAVLDFPALLEEERHNDAGVADVGSIIIIIVVVIA
jgi:hypothetical protein